jgi:PLP dependent protein
MSITERLSAIKSTLPAHVKLVAVSKTKPNELILEVYNAGQRIFGENKVQELTGKYEELPKDIEWHLLGHLQTNKVKYVAPFVSLIHSGDSIKLLAEIDKQAKKNNRTIDCLIQLHIAQEETKFGMSYEEAEDFFRSKNFAKFPNVRIAGLMGMASNVEDEAQIRNEFRGLKNFFDKISQQYHSLEVLSMGMSHDYRIAVEEGSTMVRVGSAIFGERREK